MIFAPETVVHLLRDVPLDNTYKNQLTFASLESQVNYFVGKTKYTVNAMTYQRPFTHMAVEMKADDLYDCNYIMFQNTAYSNKWFFGFVTAVEYKADTVTYVHFEIDEWQTWYFDLTIHPCYVEREHVNSDNVGEHLIDENLAIGDYVTNGYGSIDFNDLRIIVASTLDLTTLEDIQGGVYNGIYSGAIYYVINPNNSGQMMFLEAALERLADRGRSDAIVEMYMCPESILDYDKSSMHMNTSKPSFENYYNIPNTRSLNGYVPHNNKLLTYPYRGCVMGSVTGGAITLKYEFFNGTPRVRYGGGAQSSSGIFCCPENYKGEVSAVGESVTITNYPMCSWLRDNYSNWNAVQTIRSTYAVENATFKGIASQVNSGFKSLGDSMSGNLAAPLTNAVNSAYGTLMDFYDISRGLQEEREIMQMVPNSLKGNATSSPVISTGNYVIIFEERSITADYAKTIDGYFDVFGYKVSKLKVPNVNGRKYWNYVKTVGAVITGSIPRPSIDKIKQMFDTGVTFWHGDYVGHYEYDNSIEGSPTPPTTYVVTVNNGGGSGTYEANTRINISANVTDDFKEWTSNAGGSFDDATQPITVYTTPANNVVLTPTYNTPTPPEPTGQRIDEYARQFIGSVEWDANVGLWQTWYYGSYVKDAWCTTFITYCAAMVNVGDQVPKNAAAQSLYNAMYRLGKTWYAEEGGRLPKPGDICFFITSQSVTVLHHCGVVSNMGSDGVTVTYISGNTTNPEKGQPDGVFEKTTTIGKKDETFIRYFGSVDYTL